MRTRTIALAVTCAAAVAASAAPAQAAKTSLTLTMGGQSAAISSYSWGVSNSGSAHVGGGIGSGKASFADFNVVKDADAMTPALVRSAALGTHFPKASIDFTNGIFTTSYCLDEVMVSSVQHSGSTANDKPGESVSLTYAKFAIKVGTEQFGFDVAQAGPASAC